MLHHESNSTDSLKEVKSVKTQPAAAEMAWQRWPGRVSPALNCHALFTGDKCSKLFLGPSAADEGLIEKETNTLIQPEQRLKDAWVIM